MKSVLSSMTIHLITVIRSPKGVITQLNWLFMDLLWGSSEFGPRFHWVVWSTVRRPLEDGGLGIRSLELARRAFKCKL